jgi:hypothetical protein
MTDYRIYCVDGAGHITSADWIEAESDQDALDRARAMGLDSSCEIWDRQRLVGKVSKGNFAAAMNGLTAPARSRSHQQS